MPMTEQQLVSALKQEEMDAASYHSSELAAAQENALKRYHAEPFGDELPDRSKVVTHDIEDTINWIMPHLMRVFLQSDDLLVCDDPGLQDGDPSLIEAAAYLRHVFFNDNSGETVLHDYCFDALLQRVGIMRNYWEDPEPGLPRILEGVPDERLMQMLQDQEYEILEQEEVQEAVEGQPVRTWNLKVRRTPRIGRLRVECTPPEEFRISRRARSVKEADYHGWKRRGFLAPILRDFPEKRRLLDPDGAWRDSDGDDNTATDGRLLARFPDEPQVGNTDSALEVGRQKVWEHIEYLRIDYDGDGTVEIRRVRRVGDVILENDAVEESEFVAASPIRVSHRLIGRSLADTLLDLQKIRTALTRAALDGLSQSLRPRTFVNTLAIDAEYGTLDSILDHDVGGVVAVKGNVRDAVMEQASPNVAGDALAAIEYFDRRSEEASGVTRHAQGIAPDAITQTKGGIEMLQAAANSRIELVARWLAIGLEEMFEKMLRQLSRHQDGARIIKVNGKQLSIDPRRWGDEMTVSVHVGSAASDREARLVQLNMLASKQEQIIANYGPGNPLVSVQKYRATLAQMVHTMGFRSADQFFDEVPEDWQPPPQTDPKQEEMQAKMQLAQAEAQAKQQIAQAELQGRQALAQAEAQFKAREAQQKGETERAVQAMKLETERMIAAERLQQEERLAVLRMQQEREIAMLRMQQEKELALSAQRMKQQEKPNGGDFRPGGRLDA